MIRRPSTVYQSHQPWACSRSRAVLRVECKFIWPISSNRIERLGIWKAIPMSVTRQWVSQSSSGFTSKIVNMLDFNTKQVDPFTIFWYESLSFSFRNIYAVIQLCFFPSLVIKARRAPSFEITFPTGDSVQCNCQYILPTSWIPLIGGYLQYQQRYIVSSTRSFHMSVQGFVIIDSHNCLLSSSHFWIKIEEQFTDTKSAHVIFTNHITGGVIFHFSMLFAK